MAAPVPVDTVRAYIGVQKVADAQILRVIQDAARDVAAELRSLEAGGDQNALTRRAQLQAVKKQLLERQAEIYRRTGDIVEQRRTEAAAAAIRVAGRYDEAAFAALGREEEARALARGLEETELRTLDTAIARMTGAAVPLSTRVYRSQVFQNGMLERQINSALARGLSAQQMARELRDYINPNTPGGVRYAALRLARTEINNAFHAMSIQAARLKPWITKMEWHLSRSHPSAPLHRCDELAGQLFLVDEVPKKPHPQCFCYVTSVIADDSGSDDAFLDALAGGEFDDFLDTFADRHDLPADRPTPVPAASVRAVKKAQPSATPEERVDIARAVNDYAFGTGDTGGSIAGEMNSALRAHRTLSPRAARLRDELDRAFQAIEPSGRSRRLIRVVSGDRELRNRLLALAQAGGNWTDEAPMSTTSDEDIAQDFAIGQDDVQINMIAPAGTRALDFSRYLSDEPGFFDQSEFLLPRGTTLRLFRPRMDEEGVLQIQAEVVVASPPKVAKATKAPKLTKATRSGNARAALEPLPEGTTYLQAIDIRLSQGISKAKIIQELIDDFGKTKGFARNTVESIMIRRGTS